MKKAIICVDDEVIILTTLVMEIKKYIPKDYFIETATNGANALLAIERLVSEGVEIEILISDWCMPQMNGAELFSIVNEKYPKIKLVMLSGYVHKDCIETLSNIEHTFVSKPWNKEVLKLMLLSMIDSLSK